MHDLSVVSDRCIFWPWQDLLLDHMVQSKERILGCKSYRTLVAEQPTIAKGLLEALDLHQRSSDAACNAAEDGGSARSALSQPEAGPGQQQPAAAGSPTAGVRTPPGKSPRPAAAAAVTPPMAATPDRKEASRPRSPPKTDVADLRDAEIEPPPEGPAAAADGTAAAGLRNGAGQAAGGGSEPAIRASGRSAAAVASPRTRSKEEPSRQRAGVRTAKGFSPGRTGSPAVSLDVEAGRVKARTPVQPAAHVYEVARKRVSRSVGRDDKPRWCSS